MIVGILALVFYSDPQVKEYFSRLNGIPYPIEPARPVPPTQPAAPQPEPVSEPEPPVEPAPEPPAEPKKPRPRKVAAEDADNETGPDTEQPA